jgi:hypothetical protein
MNQRAVEAACNKKCVIRVESIRILLNGDTLKELSEERETSATVSLHQGISIG